MHKKIEFPVQVPIQELNNIKSLLINIDTKLTKLTKERDKDLLTPAEVCEMRRFKMSTYKRYVRDGVINQIKRGNKENSRVFVERSEIERLIEEGLI